MLALHPNTVIRVPHYNVWVFTVLVFAVLVVTVTLVVFELPPLVSASPDSDSSHPPCLRLVRVAALRVSLGKRL